MGIIKQNQSVVWLQEDGPFSQFRPYAAGEGGAGLTGKSNPIVGITPEYARDRFGNPALLAKNEDPPGDLHTLTLGIYDRDFLTILEEIYHDGRVVNLHERKVNCGTLDNPNLWSKIDIWGGGTLTTFTPGDGPSVSYNGETMQQEGQLSFDRKFTIVRNTLSALSISEADALTAIAGVPDNPEDCGTGYPGADQILYIGTETDGVAASDLLFSNNGGGSITAVTNPPFGAALDGISDVVVAIIDEDEVRVVALNAASAKWAYGDATYGDEGGMTWTEVSIAAGAASAITAAHWKNFRRGYVSNGGDIWIIEDQWESDPGTADFTGANDINDFADSPDGRTLWAVGAANTILREQNESGSFEARVGPSGGGIFHSIAIADDGTIFAGNGTSIFRNRNQAANTGGWENVKDFGGAYAVVAIQCVLGDDQTIRAIVDDATPGVSQVWESLDGGESWRQITEISNNGYNDAYFSEIDPNLAVVVGDVDGSNGVAHRLSP